MDSSRYSLPQMFVHRSANCVFTKQCSLSVAGKPGSCNTLRVLNVSDMHLKTFIVQILEKRYEIKILMITLTTNIVYLAYPFVY